MNISEIREGSNVFKISENYKDILFEGQWQIPNGVSVNAYIIKGEKTALVDGMPEWFESPDKFFKILEKVGSSLDKIDYIIVNHFEPDHSGWIKTLKSLKSDIKVICTQAGSKLLEAFYHIPASNAKIVKDGDTLDLGGHNLVFASIPNVHWPDSMVTYDASTKILLSSDAFGSFGSCGESGKYPEFDDTLTESQKAEYFVDTTRYYSNIVAAFSQPTMAAIKKAAELIGVPNIEVICPSHGIVFRKNPTEIIATFQKLAEHSKTPNTKKVTVLYGSMYGMTESAVADVVEGIKSEGVEVEVLKLPQTDLGTVLTSVWTSSGIVLGMPTYEYKMHPPMFQAIDEIFKKKTLNRIAFRFGSYGWSGGAQKELDELVQKHKPNWEFLEPVEFNGAPLDEHKSKIKSQGAELAKKVKEISG